MPETSHDDILKAIGELREESRIASTQIRGRIDGVDQRLAELGGSLERNWMQTDAHGRELVRLEALRSAAEGSGTSSPLQSGDPAAAIVIPRSLMRIALGLVSAVLGLVVIVAALAGVKLPGVMG